LIFVIIIVGNHLARGPMYDANAADLGKYLIDIGVRKPERSLPPV